MKSLIFTAPSVRGIGAGTKTQTRRLVRLLNAAPDAVVNDDGLTLDADYGAWFGCDQHGTTIFPRAPLRVGDIVYVKEAWRYYGGREYEYQQDQVSVIYKADTDTTGTEWRSPMFMPQWAARYFIQITDVRAQRVQEITEADAVDEGMPDTRGVWEGVPGDRGGPREAFRNGWDHINPKHPWSSNPWVFAYTFRRVERESKGDRHG